MKDENSLVKSIFSYSISSWVNIIIGLLYTIVSTRVLIPETYGMVSIFMSASSTLMYIVSLGLDASFIRFFNERPNNEEKNVFSFKVIFITTISILIAFLVTTVFLFDWFNEFMFGRLSWFLTIMLYGSVFSNLLLRYFNIIYRMSFNVKQYTIQNVLIQSSNKVLTLIAAFINPSFEVVIGFQVFGIIIITAVYSILQRNEILPQKPIQYLNKDFLKGYRPVLKFAVFSAPLYISTYLNTLLTQQIIRSTLGATSLGIYAAVNIFATLYGAVQTGFSTFWSAYVYKNYSTEQNKISMMVDYVELVAIVSLGGFILFRKILYLFIGGDYQSSVNFFSMVLIVNVFNLLSQSTIYGIDIAKKNYITAITNCVYVAVNSLLVYFMSMRYELMGVAIAVMITRLALFIVNTYIGQKLYKTINNKVKFTVGLIFLLIIAISPAINIHYFAAEIFTLLLLILTIPLFYTQYKNIVGYAVGYIGRDHGK